MFLVGNQMVVYTSKFKSLYTAFWHSINLSEYRIGIKFDKDPLAVKQNNYFNKIVNVSIVYDLDAWPINPTNYFKFKKCLSEAANIVKIVINKSMYIVDIK